MSPAEDGSSSTTEDGAMATSCVPGELTCSGNMHFQCGDDGETRLGEMECSGACDPQMGCVACTPGGRSCDGDVSMICAADGSGFVTGRDCAELGSTCGGSGFCQDACGVAESSRSSIGCEYWAVPLPNSSIDELKREHFDFRIVVANPDGAEAANVRVFRGSSEIASFAVEPGGIAEQALPWNPRLADAFLASTAGFPLIDAPEPQWDSPVAPDGAYRILADRPVTVAEFNPFDYDSGNADEDIRFSHSNDASLLLPAHSFTGTYVASSFPALSSTYQVEDLFGPIYAHLPAPSYFAVVGVTEEPTEVEVVATSPLAAASDGRFSAAYEGETVRFTIARGEVVVLATPPTPRCSGSRPGHVMVPGGITRPDQHFCDESDYDVTGSRITANHPIAVFGGHECAYVPYESPACDHLENQLPPLETWGREYTTGPLGDPDPTLQNVVRIVAAVDGTEVGIDPPQDGMSSLSLDAGQWHELTIDSACDITANNGIMVTQLLRGQAATNPPAERGDPAMVILPPREQFRDDYTFITPSSYNADTDGQSYVMVVRPAGLEVRLDGSTLETDWETVGDREIGIAEVDGGSHSMEGEEPFGVIVFGMGVFTSYAYPAGLNLEEILLI